MKLQVSLSTLVFLLPLISACPDPTTGVEIGDDQTARGPIGKAERGGSCADGEHNFCGEQSDDGCYCDAECEGYGDCCADKVEVCEPTPDACCSLADDPGGPEGTWCCADGSWQLDLGTGDPGVCAQLGGVGQVCEPAACCDPADDPGGPEGTWCCADGSWMADLGSGDPAICDAFGGLGDACG